MAAKTGSRNALSYGWALGENNWNTGMDNNLTFLDRFGVHLSFKSFLNTPPGSPAAGDCYAIGSAPTGAWAGKAGQVAVYDDAAWRYGIPRKGWQGYCEADQLSYVFDGTWSSSSSSADPQGPAGGSASVYTATTPIGGHRVLTMTAGGDLAYASNDDVDSIGRVLGISINAAGAGGSVSVVRAGDVEEPSWDWVVSLPIYLGANGMLTQTPPESPAVFSLIVGFPLTSTSLFFSPREPITLGD